MTDENTSGGQTLPHDHTSLPEQGGKLDFDNVTESSNLTNGDMTFANASGVMQRINNGNVVGDVLQNNGSGVPEFATPSGGITNPIVINGVSKNLDDWIKACL